MAAAACAEALRRRSVPGASGAPSRSARTSRAGAVSTVNDSRWGVGAARSKGGPASRAAGGASAARCPAARNPTPKAAPTRTVRRRRLASAKDRLQSLPRVGKVREDGMRARRLERGKRRTARAHRHDARPESEAACDILARVAHDHALGTGEGAARRGPGARENDGTQLLATRRVVAPDAEREAVPEARGQELHARAALHVAREKSGDEAGNLLERVEKSRDPRLERGGSLAEPGLEPIDVKGERVRAARGDRLLRHSGRAHEVGHDDGIEAPFERVAVDVPARAV